MAFEREEALLHGVYEITEVLGSGGFGIVLGGRHRDIDQRVAIKRIDTARPGLTPAARADLAARLRAEARMLTSLRHPHLVEVYNYETDGELHLLVMERLDGTLGRYFGQASSRSILDACAAGVAIGAALGAAHARRIVHRDIKPQNVLVAADGTVKVADFGVAKILGDELSPATNIATPVYAPPEQLDGSPITPAADVYALGITLYEILTGAPPFRGALEQLHHAHRELAPPPLTGRVPDPIAEVVLRALHKDPAGRYQTGREFAVALFAAAAHLYGPDWVARCAVPVYIDEQLRGRQLGPPAGDRPPADSSTAVPAPAPPPTAVALPALAPDGTATAPWTVVADAGTVISSPPDRPPPAAPAGRRFRGRAAKAPAPAPSTPLLPSAQSAPAVPTAPTARAPAAVPVPPPHAPVATRPPAARFVALLPDGRHLGLDGTTTGPTSVSRIPGRRRAEPTPVAVPGAHGIAVGPDGTVYVSVPTRHLVLRVDPDGPAVPVLGTGEAGYSGEVGSGRHSRVDTPYGLGCGPDGALYVADSGNGLIRRVDAAADLVETVAGASSGQLTAGRHHSGPVRAEPAGWTELSPAELVLRGPRAVALDPEGRLLVADTGNHRVLRLTLAQPTDPGRPGASEARRLAGTGQPGDAGDGGAAVRARLLRPAGVAALRDGRVLVADTGNGRVRAVAPSGQITPLAGGRYQPAASPSSAASRLRAPTSLVVLPDGLVLVADPMTGRVVTLPLHAGPGGGVTTPPAAVDRGRAALAAPAALAVWPTGGTVLATGIAAGHITTLLPDGRTGLLAVLPR
ncbi:MULTISPECIES: serine/threonine-protein kinase [Pseudofrankia]|uniref:serine/threonine-protein kinase n=1 Tax=Pseudofrankia TaxID=2994363 RepID=UPI000234CA21|nr:MULTISPECIES: serine/threonine-protein kinase [Pseudofrankia]OHV33409.1 serine/threonine protein kinase [Pseudofrankia sp. EUN1h]